MSRNRCTVQYMESYTQRSIENFKLQCLKTDHRRWLKICLLIRGDHEDSSGNPARERTRFSLSGCLLLSNKILFNLNRVMTGTHLDIVQYFRYEFDINSRFSIHSCSSLRLGSQISRL